MKPVTYYSTNILKVNYINTKVLKGSCGISENAKYFSVFYLFILEYRNRLDVLPKKHRVKWN